MTNHVSVFQHLRIHGGGVPRERSLQIRRGFGDEYLVDAAERLEALVVEVVRILVVLQQDLDEHPLVHVHPEARFR